jgi:hypothetical protein
VILSKDSDNGAVLVASLAVGNCGGLGVKGGGVEGGGTDGALLDPQISSSIAAAEVGGSGLQT